MDAERSLREDTNRVPLPRIALVSSDALRVLGLRAILGDGQLCEVVPVAPPDAMNLDRLALAIVDSSATGDVFDTIAAFRARRPGLALIVLGELMETDHIGRVIGAGAKGYLSLGASANELRTAIEVVLDGSVWAPRKVLSHLLESKLHETGQGRIDFTRREREVLALLVQGHPNRHIAAVLGVDPGTVKAHMTRLMRKAGVDNRTALGMKAIAGHWARHY